MSAEIYRAASEKPVNAFVSDFIQTVTERGFVVQNEEKMDMGRSFASHGVEVAEGFDLQMVQICKPEKAAKSLSKNPERSVLMPKFVMVFSLDGQTQVRMLRYQPQLVAELIGDTDFPGSLTESFTSIEAAIEVAL